jgi:hypothetical protein
VGNLNRWIGSRLVKDKAKHGDLVAMRFHAETFPVDDILEVNDTLRIHEEMPYEELVKQVTQSTAHIPAANELLKSGQPVCKLTLTPRGDKGGFALVFSMSHAIGDGFTYYAILNMLSTTAEAYAMNATRNESLRDGLPAQVGEEEYKNMVNPGICAICKYIGAAMTGKNAKPICHFIDKDKLKEVKEACLKEPDAAPFVSANDIITTGFARSVKAMQITMAMDFRGRLPGLTKEHAGCYHLGIIFNDATCESANNVRNVLNGPAPYSRASKPGCCMSGNWFPIISNWSSMSKGDLVISNCTQILHLPYVTAEPIDMCVVFKARPGEIAIMCFLQNATTEELQKELPLGPVVSEKMFGK